MDIYFYNTLTKKKENETDKDKKERYINDEEDK